MSEEPTAQLNSQPSLIKNRYQLEKKLGQGGMGVVYLARDLHLHNRPVVIKVLRDVSTEEWTVKKFRQEIEALVRIDHPGVVGVFDAGEMPDGQLFVVMQFVEGANLRTVLLENNGKMEVKQVAQIVDQISRALAAAHDKGVLHCDLKPENIMVQQLGPGELIVKLIDFGIAKLRDSQVTAVGPTRVAGTMEYIAPEQLRGNPTQASDIFALGVITYEMLTGKKPFPTQNVAQLIEMHREGVTESPHTLRGDLSQQTAQVVLKALSIDPAERYQKAREFSEAFSTSLQSPNSEAPTAAVIQVPERKTKVLFLAIAACLLVGIALLGWWGLRTRRETPSIPTSIQVQQSPKERTSTPLPDISLQYSILVQKYRNGRPHEKPFRLAKEILFEPDYRIRLQVRTPISGQLYLLNEGPLKQNGMPQYIVLFPSTLSNNGSASMAAEQEIVIPGKGWILFDKEQGTEKIWMIYSKQPMPQFQALEKYGNIRDKGEIRATEDVLTISEFLKPESHSQTQVERDPEGVRTIIKGKGNVLVHLLTLEHH